MGGSEETTLTVHRWGHAVTLHLVLDPKAELRALAHGGGHALYHEGRDLGREPGDWLADLGRRFERRLGTMAVSTTEACAALLELVPDAQLLRATATPLPKWSAALRSGVPREDLGGVIPFDPELAALRAGLRSVIKREALSENEAALSQRWLESQGLFTLRAPWRGGDGQIVVFASVREEESALAVDLEEALAQATSRDKAALELGSLLSYPRCCSESFARLDLRDDAALFQALLPPFGSAPAPPESVWLAGPLALVSHAPCSLVCADTLQLAKTLLTVLSSEHPGWEPRWRALARRLHVIDVEGRCLALTTEGDRIAVADELVAPAGTELSPLCSPRPELVGKELGSLSPRFVADHRGKGAER